MATIIYPVGLLVDDTGTLLTGAAAVSIASVLNPTTGAAISTPGATVNTLCLPFVSVSYDAQAHGEAVITLAVSQPPQTITGPNASPSVYAAIDSSLIDIALPNVAAGAAGGLPLGDASGHVTLVAAQATQLTAAAAAPSAATVLAAFKADADFAVLLGESRGQFTFSPPISYPGNGTLLLKDYTNTVTLATITLAFDANKIITGRAVV